MGIARQGILFALVLMVAGCAGQPKRWISHPAVETAENPFYRASLEPVRRDAAYYVGFRFAITNRTREPFFIDWNRSFYVHEERNHGSFVFPGVEPQAVRDGKVPDDVVAPGETLNREVFPFRLIAFAPLRDTQAGKRGEGIRGGPLPEGINGIYLIVRQGDRIIRGKITVAIEGD